MHSDPAELASIDLNVREGPLMFSFIGMLVVLVIGFCVVGGAVSNTQNHFGKLIVAGVGLFVLLALVRSCS